MIINSRRREKESQHQTEVQGKVWGKSVEQLRDCLSLIRSQGFEAGQHRGSMLKLRNGAGWLPDCYTDHLLVFEAHLNVLLECEDGFCQEGGSFLVPGIFEGDFPKNAPGLLSHPLLLPMKMEYVTWKEDSNNWGTFPSDNLSKILSMGYGLSFFSFPRNSGAH